MRLALSSKWTFVHEDFTRQEEIHGSSDRSFGLTMAALFAFIALGPLIRAPHQSVRWWALGVSAFLLVPALARPALLRPLNSLWGRTGLLLYRIVNPVTLGLLFYLAVTPVGLLMRIVGNDPLKLRRDASAVTYWIMRNPSGQSPQSMEQQV